MVTTQNSTNRSETTRRMMNVIIASRKAAKANLPLNLSAKIRVIRGSSIINQAPMLSRTSGVAQIQLY